MSIVKQELNQARTHRTRPIKAMPTDVTSRAVSLLGGPQNLQMTGFTPFDWVSAIRRDFPSRALELFATNLGAKHLEVAGMLGVSVRTLAERRRKESLSPYESERLLRAAITVARAEDIFGDLTLARAWLNATNISLGGVSSASLLDTGPVLNWLLMPWAGLNTEFLCNNGPPFFRLVCTVPRRCVRLA